MTSHNLRDNNDICFIFIFLRENWKLIRDEALDLMKINRRIWAVDPGWQGMKGSRLVLYVDPGWQGIKDQG